MLCYQRKLYILKESQAFELRLLLPSCSSSYNIVYFLHGKYRNLDYYINITNDASSIEYMVSFLFYIFKRTFKYCYIMIQYFLFFERTVHFHCSLFNFLFFLVGSYKCWRRREQCLEQQIEKHLRIQARLYYHHTLSDTDRIPTFFLSLFCPYY